MTNEFMSELNGKLQGIHIRLKELHWAAPKISVHKLIDEYDEEFLDFLDAIMEGAQALWGHVEVGSTKVSMPSSTTFAELLLDIRGILVSIKREAGESMLWAGIESRTDDFIEFTNKYVYLNQIALGE